MTSRGSCTRRPDRVHANLRERLRINSGVFVPGLGVDEDPVVSTASYFDFACLVGIFNVWSIHTWVRARIRAGCLLSDLELILWYYLIPYLRNIPEIHVLL